MPEEKKNNYIVSVLVPYPVDKAYSYASPEKVSLGQYVVVPLGGREVTGVVWAVDVSVEDKMLKKLKAVSHVYDDLPPMPEGHIRFLEKLAIYTMNPLGSVLKLSLSAPRAFDPPAPITGYKLVKSKGLNPKQRQVLSAMKEGQAYRAATIARRAHCSTSVIKTMTKHGFLKEVIMESDPPCVDPDFNHKDIELNEAQKKAASILAEKKGFAVTLLDGVTGSGKTEVYFEAVTQALKQNKQVLILLPEIALSNAFLERFEQRYGCQPALWHSELTPAQRRETWRAVAKGQSKVVIGARSALFLPYTDLGLIVVDEEHDPSYKQEEGVIYNARDMAVLRGALDKLPVILVSATPSLETIHNVKLGRYEEVKLPARFGGALLPKTHLIDMKEEREDAQHFISNTLKEAMDYTLERGEQVLLFLNRRGYAPLTLCRHCGHRYECDLCSAWLVEHKSRHSLQCHHCGYTVKKPTNCPECNEADSLTACGPGVERIFDEVKELFPDHTALILSSDTAENQADLKTILTKIQDKKVDIIIGTQIIAKGHHFPKLTCVGVIDADLGLSGVDLRASERTWQLLNQVSGRAGRAQDPGHVYLQTFYPDNLVMQALLSDKRDAFLEIELEGREQAYMPPFSRLVGLVISGVKEQEVMHFAQALAKVAPQTEQAKVLGPAPAPFLRLRNRYRYRLLVIADKQVDIQKTIRHWLGQVKLPTKLKLQVDVDPMSFL
jgi:primosomal protein N' (replication factor Y)